MVRFRGIIGAGKKMGNIINLEAYCFILAFLLLGLFCALNNWAFASELDKSSPTHLACSFDYCFIYNWFDMVCGLVAKM